MSDPLGVDVSTPGGLGLDPYFSLVSGGRALCEALARRLTTPRGSLLNYPDWGWDLRQYVNDDLDDADLREIERAAAQECLADERVDSVSLVAIFADDRLTLTGTVTAVTGQTFRLTLTVTDVTVALLRYSEAA